MRPFSVNVSFISLNPPTKKLIISEIALSIASGNVLNAILISPIKGASIPNVFKAASTK